MAIVPDPAGGRRAFPGWVTRRARYRGRMPEGDTIHRVAAALRPVLAGRPVVRIEAPRALGPRPAPGARIERVDAVGKHLLIVFGDGVTLRTHLRMSGTWHLYRRGETWHRPARLVRVELEVPDWTAVCFSAPVVVFERLPDLDHLGPDLCRPGVDLEACLACLDRFAGGRDVADVLLDQRIACGVGNVYKSEVCFACGIDPRTPIGLVDADGRRRLLTVAAHQLQSNLGAGPRRTVPGGLAVYGRAGRPCRRCGTRIRVARTGEHARSTYWCPACQPSLERAVPTPS